MRINKIGQHRPKRRQGFLIEIATWFGLASAILVGVGVVSYRSLTELVETSKQAANSYKVIENLEKLLSIGQTHLVNKAKFFQFIETNLIYLFLIAN